MDNRPVIVVGTDHDFAMEQLCKIADRERPLPKPAVALAPGLELRQHQSLESMCRAAGYEVTDLLDFSRMMPRLKKERPVIKAMSLAEMFKLK